MPSTPAISNKHTHTSSAQLPRHDTRTGGSPWEPEETEVELTTKRKLPPAVPGGAVNAKSVALLTTLSSRGYEAEGTAAATTTDAPVKLAADSLE